MSGEKILVVEDNPMNMELTRDILTVNGYSVVEASSAEEGISLAKSEMPNMILMDISLPGMNGLEATRILRQDNKMKDIPIVALTSHAMQGDDKKAFKAGFNGYITKPISVKKFLVQVMNFF